MFGKRARKVIFLSLYMLLFTGILLLVVNAVTKGRLSRLLRPVRISDAPNIVLIVLDTLRADHLTQYGYAFKTSPMLDKLASQSVLFENAFSTSSWTIPATSSLLSGLHPVRHGTTKEGDKLSLGVTTIAETLNDLGYDTAGFSDNIHIGRDFNFHQGFDTFFDFKGKGALAYPDMSEMMGRVKSWVRHHRGDERPFFIYMQPMNCHGPYKVPRKYRKVLFPNGPSMRFRYYRQPMADIMWGGKTARRKEVTKPYVESLVEQYDTAVRYSTDQIGRLLTFLKKRDLYDDTLIFLTSDHGEELFDHGGFAHGYSLFNEVVRIPLMMKLPKQTSSRKEQSLVSLMDIYPTIIDILDSAPKTRMDGRSLLPLLGIPGSAGTREAAKGFKARRVLLSLDWKERAVMNGTVDAEYKYLDVLHDYSGRREEKLLFHLPTDPGEKKNLGEKKRDVVNRLQRRVDDMSKAYASDRPLPAENTHDKMNVEALKALGYIQ